MLKIKPIIFGRVSIWVILYCLLLQIPSHGRAAPELVVTVDPERAAAIIMQRKDDPDFIILDIRTPSEYKRE